MRNLPILLAIVSLLFGCVSVDIDTRDFDRQLKSLSWSPNGERILYGGYDGNLRIRNVRTEKLIAIHRTRTPFITKVYWSPDAQRLLAITDKTIELLDAQGKELLVILSNPPLRPAQYPQFGPNNIRAAFSPDGMRLALAGWTDGRVQILDSQTGRIECVFTNSSKISSISWSPDGKHIAAGAWDKSIRIFDVDSGKEEARIGVDFSGWVNVQFSPDGKRLAWHGFQSDTWLQEMESKSVRKIERKGGTESIDWSPNGKQIALLGWETLDIWDVEAGEKDISFAVREWMDEVFWSPDGQYLVALSNFSGRASIWNVRTGKNIRMNDGNPLGFSPNMEFIGIGAKVTHFSRF